MILKKYLNELLKTILEQGLDINKFKLEKRLSSKLGEFVEIIYNEKEIRNSMVFRVFPEEDNFDLFVIEYTEFIPNLPFSEYSSMLSIIEVKNLLKDWINSDLKKFIENEVETDYWQIIKESPLIIENIDFTRNEPFKIEEKQQLKLGLEEIKLLISKNFALNQSEIELTNKKIDYLIESINRLNKTDWKGIAISTIFAIAYDLSFDDNKRSMLFGLFSKLWAIIQHLPVGVI